MCFKIISFFLIIDYIIGVHAVWIVGDRVWSTRVDCIEYNKYYKTFGYVIPEQPHVKVKSKPEERHWQYGHWAKSMQVKLNCLKFNTIDYTPGWRAW